MAVYLSVAFKKGSAAQRPERLYREPLLMSIVAACAIAMAILMVVDVPSLPRLIVPTAPTAR
jgi:hypothetical protein